MRTVRVVIAALLSLGLMFAPVSAAFAQANATAQQHESMPADTPEAVDHNECSCCHGATKCPVSFCGAKCAGYSAVLSTNASLPKPFHEQLQVLPLLILAGMALAPDPPPPRA